MAKCLLALGSNLGDRSWTLDAAVKAISELRDVQLTSHSNWYPSKPVGGPPYQGEYLNGTVVVETTLSPLDLLHALQELEHWFGRTREVRWAARTLDIDILLVDDRVIETAELIVPHPLMTERRFVLEPAVEIASDWVHPLRKATIGELYSELDGTMQHGIE